MSPQRNRGTTNPSQNRTRTNPSQNRNTTAPPTLPPQPKVERYQTVRGRRNRPVHELPTQQ